jgi:hypothetical protein
MNVAEGILPLPVRGAKKWDIWPAEGAKVGVQEPSWGLGE